MGARDTIIARGDVFWVAPEDLTPSIPGYPHPHVVIQSDELNQSRIPTVVVCALSSNLTRSNEPGNVRLDPGEANLTKPSMAIVSQISTVEKSRLGAHVGTLGRDRVDQILAGIAFQQRSFFPRS
jgi:mRNA interferase MazF